MNYYEHHIGDYDQATAHLTACEDGIYSRLIRWYMASEQPLPADIKTIQRRVRAHSREERAAVQTVLDEFFELLEDGYHQHRCDAEIAKYQETAPEREARKENDRERQRRTRERRRLLFEQLRAHGIVPEFDTKTKDLEAMLSRVTGPGESRPVTPDVTRDNTATHSPLPTSQGLSQPSVAPAATPAAAGAGLPGIPAAEPQQPAKRTRAPRQPAEEAATTGVWRAYSLAYAEVYGTEPVRNAKVNGQLAQLVHRLGREDAVHVAAFYVRQPFYRGKLHPVDLLLKDAEGLRTRWAVAGQGRALPDPAVANGHLDARTQHRNDRMAEALGSYAGIAAAAPTAATGARQPYDLEAEHGHPHRALPRAG